MKVDITSTLLEKGVDLAKGFLGKLIGPSVEETGLLIKENITYWKFKNQVNILNKAREYCIKKNISPKSISLKLLCPLLENGALEEDEFLQNKWAILLANMVDSKQNIENHVFPFLLSQISKTEYLVLEKAYYLKEKRAQKHSKELEKFKASKLTKEKELIQKIESINETEVDTSKRYLRWEFQNELRELKKEEAKILHKISTPQSIPNSDLQMFELSNLIRLGVIKATEQHYAYSNTYKIQNNPNADFLYVEDLEIQVESDGEVYTMSELGELFIRACTEKK